MTYVEATRRENLADAVQPVAHETSDRIITGLVTVVPILLLGFVVWQVWNEALHWSDPVVFFVDRTFLIWAIVGLAIPFGLGVAIGGSISAGLWGLLWGGAVRVVVLHHVTYSINSLCHTFGRQPFSTGDESRNLAWLA